MAFVEFEPYQWQKSKSLVEVGEKKRRRAAAIGAEKWDQECQVLTICNKFFKKNVSEWINYTVLSIPSIFTIVDEAMIYGPRRAPFLNSAELGCRIHDEIGLRLKNKNFIGILFL